MGQYAGNYLTLCWSEIPFQIYRESRPDLSTQKTFLPARGCVQSTSSRRRPKHLTPFHPL